MWKYHWHFNLWFKGHGGLFFIWEPQALNVPPSVMSGQPDPQHLVTLNVIKLPDSGFHGHSNKSFCKLAGPIRRRPRIHECPGCCHCVFLEQLKGMLSIFRGGTNDLAFLRPHNSYDLSYPAIPMADVNPACKVSIHNCQSFSVVREFSLSFPLGFRSIQDVLSILYTSVWKLHSLSSSISPIYSTEEVPVIPPLPSWYLKLIPWLTGI